MPTPRAPRRPVLLTACAAAALLGTGSEAAAQAAPDPIIVACYVPGSGTVYRIRVPEAKAECSSPQHVQFSWSSAVGGEFQLPFFREVATQPPSFWLRNTLRAPTMRLENTGGSFALFARSHSSPEATIHAVNTGSGATGFFESQGGSSALMGVANTGNGTGVMGVSNGTGAAGHFENNLAGKAVALYARASGEYSTGAFYNVGIGSAFYGESQGLDHATLGVRNTGAGGAIFAASNSPDRVTVHIENTGSGSATALYARGHGGSALYSESSSDSYSTGGFRNYGDNSALWLGSTGSRPTAQVDHLDGGQALQVNGSSHLNGNTIVQGDFQVFGTKNAVVPTSLGMRAVHAEESTEVWFTENGFGRLRDGKAWIEVDPLFAEIVSLDRPYHVFIEEYGDAELYVSRRTPKGFEVTLRGGDADVEFSYRLMAKRLGYEDNRLDASADAEAARSR